MIMIKKGIKKGAFLLNSVQAWESASEFFRMNMNHNANIGEVNSEIRDNTKYNI